MLRFLRRLLLLDGADAGAPAADGRAALAMEIDEKGWGVCPGCGRRTSKDNAGVWRGNVHASCGQPVVFISAHGTHDVEAGAAPAPAEVHDDAEVFPYGCPNGCAERQSVSVGGFRLRDRAGISPPIKERYARYACPSCGIDWDISEMETRSFDHDRNEWITDPFTGAAFFWKGMQGAAHRGPSYYVSSGCPQCAAPRSYYADNPGTDLSISQCLACGYQYHH